MGGRFSHVGRDEREDPASHAFQPRFLILLNNNPRSERKNWLMAHLTEHSLHKYKDLSSDPWYSKTGISVHAFSSSMRRQRQADPQSSLVSLHRQNCFRFIVKYGLKRRQRGVRDGTGGPTHPPALDTHTHTYACMHTYMCTRIHTH